MADKNMVVHVDMSARDFADSLIGMASIVVREKEIIEICMECAPEIVNRIRRIAELNIHSARVIADHIRGNKQNIFPHDETASDKLRDFEKFVLNILDVSKKGEI